MAAIGGGSKAIKMVRADLTGAVSIAARQAKCGFPKLLLSPFRSSNPKLRNCETSPGRRIIPVPKTGSRTFVRTRRRSNNNSPFGSVLRWCNAVRPLWRTGPRRSAAALARLVRKAVANHVEIVAATAVASRAATVEAVAIVVANHAETVAATADAIVN